MMSPGRQATRNPQGFQETFGNRIGFAAGEPPRLWRGIEALDRNHIRHAEAAEGIAHVAFADEAPQIRVLRRQRFDWLALAALRIGDVVEQERASDLHFDRLGEGPRWQAASRAGLKREYRVIAGWAGIEEIDGAEIRLKARQRALRIGPIQPRVKKGGGVERQQHWYRTLSDTVENLRGDAAELHQRRH